MNAPSCLLTFLWLTVFGLGTFGESTLAGGPAVECQSTVTSFMQSDVQISSGRSQSLNAAVLSTDAHANKSDHGLDTESSVNRVRSTLGMIFTDQISLVVAAMLPIGGIIIYFLFLRNMDLVRKETNAQESEGTPQEQAEAPAVEDGLWSLIVAIGPLWPGILASAIGESIAGPSQQYITLNWWALQHDPTLSQGPIHCDTNNLDPRCVAGVNDNLALVTKLGLITPFIHFILGPVIGSLSDSYGRRPVYVIGQVLTILPMFAMASYVYFGTSLWYSFMLSPLGDIPLYIVNYVYIVDLVPDPKKLMAGFGLMNAVQFIFKFVGLFVGQRMPMQLAYSFNFVLQVLALLYIVFLLPESLPPEKRKKLERKSLYPVVGLEILVRNSSLRRLTFILCLASFIDSGFMRFMTSYQMKYLEWTRTAQYYNNITGTVSSVLWLSIGVWVLKPLLSEVGLLLVGRACCIFWGIPLMLSTHAWQIWVTNLAYLGPISLTLPVVASMKSQLVANDEQGRMQGALATATDTCGAVGPFILGALFNATNKGTVKTAQSNIIIYVCVLLSLPILYTVISLPGVLKKDRIRESPYEASSKSKAGSLLTMLA